MSEKPRRSAVIGCGLAATELHLPALQDLPGVELVAVCDSNAERAESVARAHGVRAHHTDVGEMLQKERVDLVHVLTPPESHTELTLRAFDAGCDVLIEKPFVYTVEEADRIVEKARSTGRRFSVVHNEIFNPAIDDLRQRLQRGAVGEICSVHYLSGRRDQSFVPSDWYFETYGGRFGETLPHALCLLVELLSGLEVSYVKTRKLGHCIPPASFEGDYGADELHVELHSEGANAVGQITYSFNSNLPTSLIVSGTEDTLLAHPFGTVRSLSPKAVDLRGELGDLLDRATRPIRRKIGRRLGGGGPKIRKTSHYRQIRSFLEDLRTGRDSVVTPEKAREVVRLWCDVVAAYEDRFQTVERR